MSYDGPTDYDAWIERNMEDADPEEVLELYETIQQEEPTGDNFEIRWDGDFWYVSRVDSDDEAKIYPVGKSSSKDALLYGMELVWGDNTGEQGLRDWVEEQPSED